MIVHVSTNQGGGAGNAARRLHEGLLHQDIDSRFVSALGTVDEKNNFELLARRYPRIWQRGLRKLGFGLTTQEKWDRTVNSLDCKDVFTSGIESDSTLLGHSSVQQASILNLHWVAGILPWQSFFSKVKCPIVWTLHDMNPFLGIFHYETDRQRGSDASRAFDAQVSEQKRQLVADGNLQAIVAPSKWLRDKSQNSGLFGKLRHEHIPYGLNTKVFKPYPQQFARSVFELPTDSKLMLVVAERLDDYRKGFDLLVEALQNSKLATDWDLVAVGEGDVPLENWNCHRVGSVGDERLMALAYAAADLTVISSREDNLPNVILESLCCGTPVVGTPAGGIPEPIVNGRDGFIADSISSGALSQAIHEATSHSFNREVIAQEAADRYDEAVSAARYRKLYEELAS